MVFRKIYLSICGLRKMDLSSGHWYFRVIDNLFSVYLHDYGQENLYKLNVHFYTIPRLCCLSFLCSITNVWKENILSEFWLAPRISILLNWAGKGWWLVVVELLYQNKRIYYDGSSSSSKGDNCCLHWHPVWSGLGWYCTM